MKNGEEAYREVIKLWIYRIFEPEQTRGLLLGEDVIPLNGVGSLLGLKGLLAKGREGREEANAVFEAGLAAAEARPGAGRLPAWIEDNFRKLGRYLGLNEIEREVVTFLAVRQTESVFHDCMTVLPLMSIQSFSDLTARVLKLPPARVRAILSTRGALLSSGMVRLRNSRHFDCLPQLFSDDVAEMLLTVPFETEQILREVVHHAPPPTLQFRDFPHLQRELSLVRPYIREVLRTRRTGVNLLLHGRPGTGKSELTRMLARELRCTLYEVSSESTNGEPVEPVERLNALRLANRLLRRRSLLVFDECEDIFGDEALSLGSPARGRKAWMNRILELNSVPTLWISNTSQSIDPAFVRRFDFIMEVGVAPRGQRMQTFRRICRREISEETLQRLAGCESLAPAVVERAHRVLRSVRATSDLADPDEALELIVGHTLRAQGQRHGLIDSLGQAANALYDPGLLNSNFNLEAVADALARRASCRICLYGPPGTGKSAWALHVAARLGRPLAVHRASDLISAYHGETERNLAAAFRRSAQSGEILLLDEVDTFLQERRRALRTWEVSAVNEFLTQLEASAGTVIATTNHFPELDQAALRRFDLKIALDYLLPPQSEQLLLGHCRYLRLGEPDAATRRRLASLTHLTPGDFATVARQAPFRELAGPPAFVAALETEMDLKRPATRGPLGFDA